MSPELMSQREFKRETTNIGSLGSSMHHMRPYNHAGQYGCEYYFLYSEIPIEETSHDFSQSIILSTPNSTSVKRDGLLSRIKRRMTFFKSKECSGSGNDPESPNKGGDGTGGGRAIGGSIGGSSFGDKGGGDGGGGKSSTINGGDNSGGGKGLVFNSDSIMKNMDENRQGITINGGDMGGGGLKDNSIS